MTAPLPLSLPPFVAMARAARVFVVRVKRTDRTGIDPFHIRAWSRADAERWVRDALGNRLVAILPPRSNRSTAA